MEKTWTILDILNWTTSFLEKKDIKEAKYKTELLLSHVLEMKRFELYLNFDRPLSKKERADFKELLNRLAENEPIQYILGKWEFYGHEFIVNENVLIPRRETEELVEKIIKHIEKSLGQLHGDATNNLYILDIGTGSGAIIISLYKEIMMRRGELHSPSTSQSDSPSTSTIQFIATDISEEALKIAKQNAELNGIEEDAIQFIQSDLFNDLEKNTGQIDFAHTIMISNPPYVSLSEYNELEKELAFEPQNAITDNGDGLYFYIELIKQIKEKKIKKSFFEFGYNQKDALEKLCKENNLEDVKFYKDLSSKWRMMEIDYWLSLIIFTNSGTTTKASATKP